MYNNFYDCRNMLIQYTHYSTGHNFSHNQIKRVNLLELTKYSENMFQKQLFCLQLMM